MQRVISLLGSTGSIGTQTLKVAKQFGYKIEALAAHSNIDLIEKQAREFSPALVALFDADAAKVLKERLSDTNISVLSGIEGVCKCAKAENANIVVGAMSGMIGLKPTLEAVNAGKDFALANKETLVTAGGLVTQLAAKKGVKLLPVDSEHNAISQCMRAGLHGEVKRLILTCSGGPFFGYDKDELSKVTAADALNHPTWSMGSKITIDCATLMNKGLEVIEAMWLFGVPVNMIDVVIHRESVIHSMVEYNDGAVIAELAKTDMCLPIQYALTYPNRISGTVESLDFTKLSSLTFHKPDTDTFGCLKLAYEAACTGGSAPVVLNASNEAAVALFLENKISFTDIEYIVNMELDAHNVIKSPALEDIIYVDKTVRERVFSNYGG